MALKDLLVHVNNARSAKAVVAAAAALASRHNAHIVGLGIRPPLDMPRYASARLPESVVEIMEAREKELLEASEEVFNSTTAMQGSRTAANGAANWAIPTRCWVCMRGMRI